VKAIIESYWGAVVLVVVAMMSLTLGATLAKTLFQTAGPGGVTVLRVGVGAALLCALWRPWLYRLSKHQLRDIALYGITLGVMNLLFYHSIARLPIGLAIAIEFLGPLAVALIYSRRKIDLLWAFFAAVGILLILPFHEFSSQTDSLGVFFALGAAAAWALYIVLGKKAGRSASTGAVTSIGMTFALLSTLPFGAQDAAAILTTPNLIPLALGMGVLSSALPYSLEMQALKRIPEKSYGLLMSLEPAIGAVIAYLLLSETLTLAQCLAVVFIILASVGSTYSHQKSEIDPVVA
jgi:inner membrane transporter RhtA